MNETVEYEGNRYLWSNGRWLDAKTHMPPPGYVQSDLNHLFRHLVQPAPDPKKRTASKSSQSKEIQQTIGPIIIAFVRQCFAETNNFVHRDEIVAHLFAHAKALSFLQKAYAASPQQRDFEWYVGNQVDWLGANLEDESRTEFDDLLVKTEMPDGKRGYRPKWHTFIEGQVYHRDVVVETIKGWLPETGEQKLESKEANLAFIAAGPEKIRFEPVSEGWGRSAGNAACWVDAATGKRLKF